MTDMLKIYFSHAFGNKSENKDHLETLLKEFVTANIEVLIEYGIVIVSPIHALDFMYTLVSYEEGMRHCLGLLADCDLLVTFHGHDNSTGVKIEKAYADLHNIPQVEFNDLLNYLKTL